MDNYIAIPISAGEKMVIQAIQSLGEGLQFSVREIFAEVKDTPGVTLNLVQGALFRLSHVGILHHAVSGDQVPLIEQQHYFSINSEREYKLLQEVQGVDDSAYADYI